MMGLLEDECNLTLLGFKSLYMFNRILYALVLLMAVFCLFQYAKYL